MSSELSIKDLKFNKAGMLKAYSLIDGNVTTVMDLSGYQFPNGLDALPQDDAILIADEDFFLANGGVSKASFDFSSGQPVLTDYIHQWIGPDQKVYAANGVRVVDGAVYITDIGFFKRVPINSDGSPAQAQILFRNLTVLDDFDQYCDGFLITDFVKGRLVYVPIDGSTPTISEGGLSSPSALLANPGILIDDSKILITESRGLQAGSGNQLVQVRKEQLGIDQCALSNGP